MLTRELPHLRALIRGEVPGLQRHVARRLARRALDVAQGHPKLLELADGQAAHLERLADLLDAGDQAWRKLGGLPEGFFTTGQTTTSGEDYLQVLAAWTKSVADTLAPGERELFWFLCCLEESDRTRPVLNDHWAETWHQLGHDDPPLGFDQVLAAVTASGLASTGPKADDASKSYTIHPGVASAGRAHAGKLFRDAVDAKAAAYWRTVYERASGETGGAADIRLLVRADLSAAPYFVRKEQWAAAATIIEHAFNRSPTRGTAAIILPALQEITGHDPRQVGVLFRVLQVIDPSAAEAQLRAVVHNAVAHGDYRAASVVTMWLMYRCRESGRLAEALALADQAISYTQEAHLGPWTRLGAEIGRLQLLNEMGQASKVLTEVWRLLDQMPARSTGAGQETGTPWNVHETLLDTGHTAAVELGRWDDALDLNAARIAEMRARRAPDTEMTQAKFIDYFPLLRLGRTGQALALLLECRQVFDDAKDIEMLGMTFNAIADTEDMRGHGDAAIRLQRDALRYGYLAGNVISIAIWYHNLGNYLHRHAHQATTALACHLAAALMRALTGANGTANSIRAARADLRAFGPDAALPTGVADLCRQVGDIPGTDLPGLIAKLSPDPASAERAFYDLIAQAQALEDASPEIGHGPVAPPCTPQA